MTKSNAKKKPGITRSLYIKPSVAEAIDERAENAGARFGPFVLDRALADLPATRSLPVSLQTEMAVSIFTMRKLLETWIAEGESAWAKGALEESIAESLRKSHHVRKGMFGGGDETPDKETQAEIATSVLTIDGAMKAYLEKAGMGELYESARNQARIRVLREIGVG